jgi:tRNA G10  N-methylase Trm11
MINTLGGTIAIGKVLISGNKQEIIKYIKEKEIYLGEEIKFNYTVHDFSETEESAEIKDLIKRKFREERLKANLRNRELKPEQMRNMINYFIYEDCFGIIEAISNTQEIEKRDMSRPVRRHELAISPRLAKILINLAQVRENQTLADPFCGIGVIMQEALLQDINVIGVDKDKKTIFNCERNLEWLEKTYKTRAKYKLINNDSKTVRLNHVDAIACEPNLGEILQKYPKLEDARETIRIFEDLIVQVLNNIGKYLKPRGKIAFTAPSIKAAGTRTSCNIEKIMHKTGLKLAEIPDTNFPLMEQRKGQVVAREIYVLEK